MRDPNTWTVPPELGGERLDRIVAVLAGVSRAVARELVESGDVMLDGEPAPPATRVLSGRVVAANAPELDEVPVPGAVPFEVKYEDEILVIVEKPAGVVTHPGAGHRNDTLLNGLVARYPGLLDVGREHRYGIVHRLDRGTSGLLVVARTATSHRALQAALRRREIERVYLALAAAALDAESGTIDAPIGRDPRHPTRMALVRDGRPARTHYELAARWSDHTLLRIHLETGRTHQIRVHLASIGAPIVGDETYGRAGNIADPGRVWLHASRLALTHPRDGSRIEVEAPLPADLGATFEVLGDPTAGSLP